MRGCPDVVVGSLIFIFRMGDAINVTMRSAVGVAGLITVTLLLSLVLHRFSSLPSCNFDTHMSLILHCDSLIRGPFLACIHVPIRKTYSRASLLTSAPPSLIFAFIAKNFSFIRAFIRVFVAYLSVLFIALCALVRCFFIHALFDLFIRLFLMQPWNLPLYLLTWKACYLFFSHYCLSLSFTHHVPISYLFFLEFMLICKHEGP